MRVLLLALVLAAPALAAPSFGPEGWARTPEPARPPESASAGGAALSAVLAVWRSVLSPVDGPRCPMYPTCSAYCALAMRRYGPARGLVMTAARLLKETPDLRSRGHYPARRVHGKSRLYDPPERDEL